MSDDTSRIPEFFPDGRKPGEILFSALMIILGGLLLAALPWQTSWIDGRGFAAQPRFWPALSLAGLILFGACHFGVRQNVTRTPGRWKEGLNWILSLEYVAYYMVYVWAIPKIGYLLATLLFCVLLTYRVGYRGRALWIAGVFALFVVLTFKTGFNVKIPAGAIYDFAPEGLRYFLIRYF
jgi:hypothetical protein